MFSRHIGIASRQRDIFGKITAEIEVKRLSNRCLHLMKCTSYYLFQMYARGWRSLPIRHLSNSFNKPLVERAASEQVTKSVSSAVESATLKSG